MQLIRRHTIASDWLELTRASNIPTVVTDALVGVAMAALLGADTNATFGLSSGVFESIASMCAFYAAGMVLNSIVDRSVDSIERPTRPIAAGRIRLPWAWTGFIVLMFVGFLELPGFASAPVPAAAAALIGAWTVHSANILRSHRLLQLGRLWWILAIIAAIWWAGATLLSDPFDLRSFAPHRQSAARASHIALNFPVILLAISLIAYNLLHQRGAWTIALLALCRFLVPVSVMMAIICPSGVFDTVWALTNASLLSPPLLLLFPLGIALHTAMLSTAARREMASQDFSWRCAKCGYPVGGMIAAPTAPVATARCSECGCDFSVTAPIGDRSMSRGTRRWTPLIASIGLIPCALLLVPVVFAVQRLVVFGVLGAARQAPPSLLGLVPGISWRIYWLISVGLFVFSGILFIIASTRGLRAAISHPSRRPRGIGALIAALALLDAAALAAMIQVELALIALAMWVLTRWLQRRIPAS